MLKERGKKHSIHSKYDVLMNIKPETELRRHIHTLLQKKYSSVHNIHGGRKELLNKTDFLAVDDTNTIYAFQVKQNEEISTLGHYTKIANTADRALKAYYTKYNSVPFKFFWISTGIKVPIQDEDEFKRRAFDGTPRAEGRVEIWGVEELYKEFKDNYPNAFIEIKIDSLDDKVAEFKKNGNYIFATYFSFRIFILCLLNNEFERARFIIDDIIHTISKQANKKIFYFRSLTRFYQIWKNVLEYSEIGNITTKIKEKIDIDQIDDYERTWQECIFLQLLINNDIIKAHVEELKKNPNINSLCDYNFLCDFQYIYSQLQILFHEYADAPAGLSSKQICRTLLRFGFPPIKKVHDRIKKMKIELANEGGHHLDSECSLCTSTVLSCLALINENEEIIRNPKKWLESLDYCRYCHLKKKDILSSDAESTEHAMHYAAQVLQAFVDCGDNNSAYKVFEHYFDSTDIGKNDGFPQNWMKHRNISNLETCAYIFSAFRWFLLSDINEYKLNQKQQNFVRNAVENLVEILSKETAPESKTWRLFASK